MSESSNDLKIRSAIALIPLGATVWLAFDAEGPYMAVFISFPGLMAVALVMLPSLTSVLGEGLNDFLFPQSWNNLPKAPLSNVYLLQINNQWDEAETSLIELGKQFPYDMEVWGNLFRLTWVKLGDQDRARASHKIALQCTTDPKLPENINHLYTINGQSHLGIDGEWKKESESMRRRMHFARITAGLDDFVGGIHTFCT
jgi:hypothetical protein